MMRHKKFAVFILSHGRAGNVRTLRPLLSKGHYSGDWYIVLDNEDDSAEEYKRQYGDEHIIIFDRPAIIKLTDPGTNDRNSMGVVFARNACWDIAKNLGLDYFLMLEDDYTGFFIRYPKNGSLKAVQIENLDKTFDAFINFLEKSNAATVAMAQGGDLIGGSGGSYNEGLRRKAMNTFFCMTSRRIWFMGKNNDDVTTYVTLSNCGVLFFTVTMAAIVQQETQKQKGGMSEFFKNGGAGYVKPFTTIIFAPQAVKIRMMGISHRRLHHNINWNLCAPKILNERWRKTKRSEAT